jgi:hypothetical protein
MSRGWWGLALNAEDNDPDLNEIDREFDFRGFLYRQIDCMARQGIARDAAIRFLEDKMAFPRGVLTAYLER